jgi:S-adenosylmethionine:tRNA ribosyltransferase-isomerase
MFSLSDYRYTLPEELIAQEAVHPHHDARMMVINKQTGNIEAETTFWHLDEYLGNNRVMFFNDSRVVRSRVVLNNTPYTKTNGITWLLSDGEIFYLSSLSETTFSSLVRPGNKFNVWTSFEIGDYTIKVLEINESGRILEIIGWSLTSFLETHGALPLPPYIKYSEEKEIDYQTSFAKNNGSVAAPTASLHFTKELMNKIQTPKEYITLHVGLWTFKWIQTPDIRDYNIHSEKIEVQQEIFKKIADIREIDKKIVAVGTTAIRTLESLPYLWRCMDIASRNSYDAKTCNYWNSLIGKMESHPWIHNIEEKRNENTICFETSIYITPGYIFRIVDDIITNFHLWESSLLVLVSAFLGYENTKKIYEYAIKSKYRFYSFGDGMYIRWK